jgi:hypothetical protein
VRERWLGATGRKVPELAVEGELELPPETLVVDDVTDVDPLRRAHEQGTPIAARAETAEQVKAALSRPEVATVLVPASRRELLELDLTELTYGER